MGGQALKTVCTTRLPADVYFPLAADVVSRLLALFPGLCAQTIPAVRTKPDFGDLDVLIAHPDPTWRLDAARQSVLAKAFEATEMVSNGPVLSFDVGAPGDTHFQVDLIRVDADAFPFALGYFGHNDLGNLLGRVARSAEFKLAHTGLYKVLRDQDDPSRYVTDVLVTSHWSQALDFLGYDSARWGLGFDTFPDLFSFVASSPFFDPAAFPLEHRSHRARIRDRKRPTYTAFLDWLNDRYDMTRMSPEGQAVHLSAMFHAQQRFPDFQERWQVAEEVRQRHAHFRERFNGAIVRNCTGLSGEALGAYMASLRAQFPSQDALERFVLVVSHEELRSFIRGNGFDGPALI